MGLNRLTTTRVADRAGVSVGTLYQYYPNKQALLYAVLEAHSIKVVEAVEHACRANRDAVVKVLVAAVVEAFVNAKLERTVYRRRYMQPPQNRKVRQSCEGCQSAYIER